MGEDVAPSGEYSGSVAEGAGHMDVLGANLHLAWHPTADARRREEVCTGRQNMARYYEERSQRTACSRYHRNRKDAGTAEEELRTVRTNSKGSERLLGEKETLFP